MHHDASAVRRAEDAEMRALASRVLAARPDTAAALGLSLYAECGAVACFATAVDVLTFNRVLGLGLHAPATPAQLDRVLGIARSLGVRRMIIQPAPDAAPAALHEWIAERGGEPYNRWVRLWRSTAAPLRDAATDLRIERIGAERADEFARVAAAVFGLPAAAEPWIAAIGAQPEWRLYGAFDGDAMVATGALHIASDTGWLGFGATLPSHRGRGAQGALIVHRVREAAALGCAWVVTETAEETPEHPAPSWRNMRRLQFTEAYRRQNYLVALAPGAG